MYYSTQTTETLTHLMVRMDFWPTLTPLVRVCRVTPTLTMMSTGPWEKDQVIRNTNRYSSTPNIYYEDVSPQCSIYTLLTCITVFCHISCEDSLWEC